MKIIINGEEKNFATPLKVSAALKVEGFEGKMVAVAVNGQFLPKACYPATMLQDGDQIEIVSAMQGG